MEFVLFKSRYVGPGKADPFCKIKRSVGTGGMGCDHENVFTLSRKVEGDSSLFLMIPSIKSLRSDAEVFSDAAKEQLRKTAQMDRMLDSKKAIEKHIGIIDSPYCVKFYEQSYSEWYLGNDSEDPKEVCDAMQVE